MGKGWFTNYFHKNNSEVEIEHGRRNARRSIEEFIKNLWDAPDVRKRVEKILRKPSRKEEDERIRAKQEKETARNLRLTRLSNTEGWNKDIVNLLKRWEVFSYMNLRFPENRKDKIDVKEFYAFQRGALWIIEGLRDEINKAVKNYKKQQENAIHDTKEGK